MNLLQTVKRIVADQFDKQVDEIGDDASFKSDIGADDLDSMEIILAIEEEFGRAIPDQDAQQLDTVNDIVTYCRDALKIEEPSSRHRQHHHRAGCPDGRRRAEMDGRQNHPQGNRRIRQTGQHRGVVAHWLYSEVMADGRA